MASSEAPRIVVGVDGSSSYDALRWADRYARLVGGAVEAVCVWESPTFVGWGGGPATEPVFDVEQARQRFARELDEVFADGLPEGLTQRLVEGDPSDVLIHASEGAEVLVVGRRGRGGFARAVLGSVSQRCAQHAACPVVVVRQEGDSRR
ncbi:universal stress protein [Streptomyces cellulosae]